MNENEKPRTGDDAVRAATGRDWETWFHLLDERNSTTLPHNEIAAYLHNEMGVPGWWAQGITVEYELVRGMRQRHEGSEGYKVSVSRVVNVPVTRLYRAWDAPDQRTAWLGDNAYTVSTANENKSIRARWNDETRINVNFYEKGDAKSQVVVEHTRLADADDAEARKAFWRERLDALKEFLEAQN